MTLGRLALASVLVLGVTSCVYNPKIGEAHISCGTAADCQPNEICTASPITPSRTVCCFSPGCRTFPAIEDGPPRASSEGGPEAATPPDSPARPVDAPEDSPSALPDAAGDTSPSPDATMPADTAADVAVDAGCPAVCAPGAHRCEGGALLTCVMSNGCPAWDAGVACSTGQTCQGEAPGAACGCPSPPAECSRGQGTSCESTARALTCIKDAQGCVSSLQRTECPAGKPCTGTFPAASCSCPPPPPECAGRTGRFCTPDGHLAECAADAVTSCVGLQLSSCMGGKVCTGMFPDALCACSAANAGSPCGMCGGTVECGGSCTRPTPPAYGQSCARCGGTVQCDGSCSKPEPPGFGQSCGHCGGTIQCDGVSCSRPDPATYGHGCGHCGGTFQCDGSCSTPDPATYGQSCGHCGGTFRCDGTCSTPDPATYGQSCGHCGGTLQCDGSCSRPDPGNLGQGCQHCGGTFQCDGSCSRADPAGYGQGCEHCGGAIQCDGACSVPDPPGWGSRCNACRGTVQCDRSCSPPDPPDLNVDSIVSNDVESFGCCFVDYVKAFGRDCDPAHQYSGVEVIKINGGGTCQLVAEQDPASCGVQVRFHNNGLEGATCRIVVHQRGVCN
jgi:hypothetical protein